MKIAVAAMGHTVAGHFGHCENFIFFDVEDNKIVDEKSVPNPGHRPGFLPNFLADNGAEVIIAGGMGGGAVDIFKIAVIVLIIIPDINCYRSLYIKFPCCLILICT